MSAITTALVATLSADAVLTAFLPDGVWAGVPPLGKKQYAIVSHASGVDTYVQGPATAFETHNYLVKAVTLGASGLVADQAAARMHQLLHDRPIAIAGYHLMSLLRVRPIEDPEVDDDADIHWQHRGGYYQLMVQPLPVVQPLTLVTSQDEGIRNGAHTR